MGCKSGWRLKTKQPANSSSSQRESSQPMVETYPLGGASVTSECCSEEASSVILWTGVKLQKASFRVTLPLGFATLYLHQLPRAFVGHGTA